MRSLPHSLTAWEDPAARSNAVASAYLALPVYCRYAVGPAMTLKRLWDFYARMELGIKGYQYSCVTGAKAKRAFLDKAVSDFFESCPDAHPDHPVRALESNLDPDQDLRAEYIKGVRKYIENQASHYAVGKTKSREWEERSRNLRENQERSLVAIAGDHIFAAQRQQAVHALFGSSEEASNVIQPLLDAEMSKWDAEWAGANPGEPSAEVVARKHVDRDAHRVAALKRLRSNAFERLPSAKKEAWYADMEHSPDYR